MSTTSHAYARSFQANCPLVRMLPDEIEELARLFHVAKQEAYQEGATDAYVEISRKAKSP